MKLLEKLLLALTIISFPTFAIAQTQIYSEFKTNDEENNIEVFKLASPSVVHITNSRLVRSFYSLNPQEVPQGTGTGFIWNDDGYVVTNFHVVQQASVVTVTLQNGSSYEAIPIGSDPDKDLAVLKIDVEGYEMEVLKGAEKTLNSVSYLMIELNNNSKKYGSSNLKIENYLYKKGFTTMIKAWPDVVWRKKGKRK